ncbi:unnamed protein product [Psylliodes chrysocephalus]|uniref:Uncharacterized protein n=1 Tax=Psylliodes chrysocephalus TaxID=3402493 RepID=A0A9P0CMM6_9CUCU|nr:unnamed protein product [Psylliodes chrysocephala]
MCSTNNSDNEEYNLHPISEVDVQSENSEENSEEKESKNKEPTNCKKKRKLKVQCVQKCRLAYIEKFKWIIDKDGCSFCKYGQKIVVGGYSHLSRHENSLMHKKKENAVKICIDIKQYQPKLTKKKYWQEK